MKVQNTHRNKDSKFSSGSIIDIFKGLVIDLLNSAKNLMNTLKHPIKLYQESLYKTRKVMKVIWPINWSKLQNYSLITNAVKHTSQKIKITLAVLLICMSIALISLFGSFYNVLTVETADNKGIVNEGVFGQSITKLNPLLTSGNDTEKKIIDLIYQPLFRLEYPNFLETNDKVKILPVLLESEPSWSIDKKVLNLKLKRDLKWSDNSTLDSRDVVYSYNRLKEVGGNLEYRDLFANYKLSATSPIDMELTQISAAKGFNPQIKYLLGFYPVSAKYFEDKNTEELNNSPKSLANEVSSGYFMIPPKVKIDGKEIQNPTKDVTGSYQSIVLERNDNNVYNPPLVERYTIKSYSDLVDIGGNSGANSIERASVNKKLDLFVRHNNAENKISNLEIKDKLQLDQSLMPTNTYYIMYANLQSNQWLINTLLRKYTLCSLADVLPGESQISLTKIKTNKQFLPIQLQDSFDPNCNSSRQELLSQQKAGRNPYTESNSQILVDDEAINLNILTLQELIPLMRPIQDQLKSSGIESTITTVKDTDELDQKISEKTYNLIFLPTTIISNDPYPMYGGKSRNISSINKNNRIGKQETKFGEGTEKVLKDYSESNLENTELQSQVKDFFKTEFVSLNMFASNIEINYSPRLSIDKDKSSTLNNLFGKTITFGNNVYDKIPQWYVETKKKFLWE